MPENHPKKREVFLTSWDGRPAISYPNGSAVAILAPGDYWEPVDGADVLHTAKVIGTGDEFKEKFLETYGKPISSAAEWYEERSPYQDLVSMYWRVDGDMTNSHEVDRIKLMTHLAKQKR